MMKRGFIDTLDESTWDWLETEGNRVSGQSCFF